MTQEFDLTEVLEEYALLTPMGNDAAILRETAEKYPQFADELRDFAAARAIVKYAPETKFTTEETQRFEKIGFENLHGVLGESRRAFTKSAVHSLIETAKAKNMNRKKFADALGLSVSLIQYLEKRRLEFETIPQKIINKLGEVLETTAESVADYLRKPPVSTANASFKATERPSEIKQETFAEAVREDQQLSPNEKQHLLNL